MLHLHVYLYDVAVLQVGGFRLLAGAMGRGNEAMMCDWCLLPSSLAVAVWPVWTFLTLFILPTLFMGFISSVSLFGL